MADRIVIRREGTAGGLAILLAGNSITRVLFVYGIMAVSLIGLAIYLAVSGHFLLTGLALVWAAVILRGVVRSRHFSAIAEIPRNAIESIEVHEPRLATRGYFLVYFRLGDAVKKRIIMLPGSMSGGSAEFQHALVVLQNHGLIGDDRGAPE